MALRCSNERTDYWYRPRCCVDTQCDLHRRILPSCSTSTKSFQNPDGDAELGGPIEESGSRYIYESYGTEVFNGTIGDACGPHMLRHQPVWCFRIRYCISVSVTTQRNEQVANKLA